MNKSNLKLEKENIDDLNLNENKGISEPLEKDDILYKLYEQNFDKFENISQIMKYTQILSYIFSFIFLIFLIIKFTSKGKFNWTVKAVSRNARSGVILRNGNETGSAFTIDFNMTGTKLKDTGVLYGQ